MGFYNRFITSAGWRTSPARLEELEASGFRCRVCNAGPEDAQLEVHHRTYERLGCEETSDLTTLCSECHVVVTDSLRRRRYAGRALSTVDHRQVETGCDLNELLSRGGRP